MSGQDGRGGGKKTGKKSGKELVNETGKAALAPHKLKAEKTGAAARQRQAGMWFSVSGLGFRV